MTRLGGVILFSVLASGCHTIEAVESLSRPAGIHTVHLESGEAPIRTLGFRAEYGQNRSMCAFGVNYFTRSVSGSGTWEFPDPRTICVVTHAGVARLPAREEVTTFDLFSRVEPSDAVDRWNASELGCTHLVHLEDGTDVWGWPDDVALLRLADGSTERLALPPERPLRDPERWGWLAASPVLDAVTIPLVTGVLIVAGGWELYDWSVR